MNPLSKTGDDHFPSNEGRGKVHLEFQEQIVLYTRKNVNDIISRLDAFLGKEGIRYSIDSSNHDFSMVKVPWYQVGFGSALKHEFHFRFEENDSQINTEITVFRLEPHNYISLNPESIMNWKFFVLRVLTSINVDITKDFFFKIYDKDELVQLKRERNSKWVMHYLIVVLLFVNLFPKPVWVKIIDGDLIGVMLVNGVFFFIYWFISRIRSHKTNVDMLIEQYFDP